MTVFFNRLKFLSGVPSELRSNFIHFFFDIGWWAIYAGATAAFLNVYAVRAGATPGQIGLLSALPSALTLAVSLPLGRMMSGVPSQRVTLWAAIAGRLMFLLYVFVPWLPSGMQVSGILFIAVIFTIPSAVIGISFNEFLMEAIPPDWRGMLVSGRMAIYAVVTFLVTLLCGQILTRLPFPRGYQVVFFLGFVGGIMTVFHIARVRTVTPPGKSHPAAPGIGILARLKASRKQRLMPKIDASGLRYLRVIGLLFLFNTVNNMVAPLIPEVLVNRLVLPDSAISVGTALANMLFFLVSILMARMTRRWGNRNSTAFGAALVAGHAVVMGLAQNVFHYYLASFIGGIGSGVLSTAQFNYHLENVPEQERTVWLSWNLLLGNAAVLIGSLGGPAVAGLAGIPFALLLFGLLRLTMGAVIVKWG